MLAELYLDLEPINENFSSGVLEESIEEIRELGEIEYRCCKRKRGVMESFLIGTIYEDIIYVGLEGNGGYRVEIMSGSFERVKEYGEVIVNVRDRYFNFYGPRGLRKRW